LKGLVTESLAATGALIRSQFRPKLRYRNPARGMGVQRAKKTQGGFGPPSFVHALSPECCVAQLGLDHARRPCGAVAHGLFAKCVSSYLVRYPAFPWAGNSTGPLWRPPIPWAGTSVTALGHSRGGFFVPVDVYPVHREVVDHAVARPISPDLRLVGRLELRRTGAKPSLGGLRATVGEEDISRNRRKEGSHSDLRP
jgi:hypothetical protein